MPGSIVDIEYMNKGSSIAAISAVTGTTTSAPIDARGKNAVLLKLTFSGAANWTIKLTGCFTRNGTYVDIWELANTGVMAQMSYQTNASKMILFKGIPDWIKVTATEDAGAETVSVEAQLLNV
jgi:hypothetical protein